MSTIGSMPEKQAALLSYLFDHLAIGDSVNTLDFSLSGGTLSRHYAAYAQIINSETELYVVFNLPGETSDVFLGLAYGNASELVRIFATLEEFEATNRRHFDWGGVLSIGTIDASNPPGIAFLRTASADELCNIPDRAVVLGREHRFLLAVPLEANELLYRQKLGHDALMDKFEAESKDIVFDL